MFYSLLFQVRANQSTIRNVSRGAGDELRGGNSENFHGCESVVEGEAERDLPQRWGPLSGDSVVHRSSLERDRYVHEHAAPRRDGKNYHLYIYNRRREKRRAENSALSISLSFNWVNELTIDRFVFSIRTRFHPNFIDKVKERERDGVKIKSISIRDKRRQSKESGKKDDLVSKNGSIALIAITEKDNK